MQATHTGNWHQKRLDWLSKKCARVTFTIPLLPRERGGCAKNSENSGRSRIVRRKGIRAGDEEVVMFMTHRKEKEHDIEVQINSRKVYPAVKRGREVGK